MALVAFTGGARSGKSSAAQALAAARDADGAAVTVVVFGRASVDDEFAKRVARHRADRPKTWTTVEITTSEQCSEMGIDEGVVLFDCLGTALGLVMEEVFGELSSELGSADAARLPDGFETEVRKRFACVLDKILGGNADIIVVTNEVGDGVVPAYASGRLFRDLLGQANRTVIDRADVAFLCVAGRLIELSGLPRTARWPDD